MNPRFIKLCNQILSPAIGSNFHTFNLHHPQTMFWLLNHQTIQSVSRISSNLYCLCIIAFSFNFSLLYRFLPFLFQNYQQIASTAFLKAKMQKMLSLSVMKPKSSKILTLRPWWLCLFLKIFIVKRHLKSLP